MTAVARTYNAVLHESGEMGIFVLSLFLEEKLPTFYHGVWC